jgi:hypothetical protein
MAQEMGDLLTGTELRTVAGAGVEPFNRFLLPIATSSFLFELAIVSGCSHRQ